ncbi:hypothetical protein FRC02_001929 [Tulasnella sp. 418]|nr:hypothetical protein FRC02_001929 [Tulasnella sp. 418]
MLRSRPPKRRKTKFTDVTDRDNPKDPNEIEIIFDTRRLSPTLPPPPSSQPSSPSHATGFSFDDLIEDTSVLQMHRTLAMDELQEEIQQFTSLSEELDDVTNDVQVEQVQIIAQAEPPELLRTHYLPYFYAMECPSIDPPPSPMLCRECCNTTHQSQPFHTIRSWAKREQSTRPFFKRSPPSERGFILHLGHFSLPCSSAKSVRISNVRIVDVNGFHDMTVSFCRCGETETPAWAQLLRHRLFPSTEDEPSTAFTFRLLRHFEQFNLSSQTAAWDYYRSICHFTDPLGASTKKAYNRFVKIMRQWRMLQLLKRCGRMDDLNLRSGELVVRCRACPIPGENLPESWVSDRYASLLYARFLQGDGNFHQQLRANRPGPLADRSNVRDGGFWAPQETFEGHIQSTHNNDKRSTDPQCQTRAGVPSRGVNDPKLSVTGIYAVSCRHLLFQPSGVVDFFKGERFSHVDVAVASVMQEALQARTKRIVFSYDVNCKYSRWFQERVTAGDDPLIPENLLCQGNIQFVIPKFHLASHQKTCADRFSFNYTPFVGRMSGEGVETLWPALNGLQYSIREMGWGSRRDLLTHHMNHHNWLKSRQMSDRIYRDFCSATIEAEMAMEKVKGIEENLGEELSETMRSEWLQRGGDQYRPNPETMKVPSKSTVLRELQQQETSQNLTSSTSATGSTSPSSFVHTALILEEDLIKYTTRRTHLVNQGLSPSEEAKLKVAATALQKRIDKHYHLLRNFAPSIPAELLQAGDEVNSSAIVLPSSLSDARRLAFGLEPLTQVEVELRVGHLHDILEKLRRALGSRSYLSRHSGSARGYKLSTRAQESIRDAELVVKQRGRGYKYAWDALVKLIGEKKAAAMGLQPLHDDDLVMLSSWLEDARYTKKESRLPWIWTMAPFNNSKTNIEVEQLSQDELGKRVDEWNCEAARLEYVHALAAAERWKEEVLLLKEEARRLAVSFRADQAQWARKAVQPNLGDDIGLGYAAYAAKQADYFGRLAESAENHYKLMSSVVA